MWTTLPTLKIGFRSWYWQALARRKHIARMSEIRAESVHLHRPIISAIPTSIDHLNIMFEADMSTVLPRTPGNWLLNDGFPEMGTRCRILPTGEIAIYLKTLDLVDSPRLEERLLKNVRRLLGHSRLDVELAAAGLPKDVPVVWALLWIPDSFPIDPGGEQPDMETGTQQLWPKVLLSSPVNQFSRTHKGSEEAVQRGLTRSGLQDRHTQSKSASSLINEALDISAAMSLVETSRQSEGDNAVDHFSSNAHNVKESATAKFDADDALSAPDPQKGTDGTDDEDEDDLFASSPSPALEEIKPTPQDHESLDVPIAVDSVDRVSSAIFSPTLQPMVNHEVTKYDISPRDQENPVNGFEAMITDDDFDFFDFDGQGTAARNGQPLSYEEYGDLSSVDFGVNMNRTPDRFPAVAVQDSMSPDTKSPNLGMDSKAPQAPWLLHDMADGFQVRPDEARPSYLEAAAVNTPRLSIASDDDLWNDDTLPEQTEEAEAQVDIDMDHCDFERIDTQASGVEVVPTPCRQKSRESISAVTALPTTPKSTPQDDPHARSAMVENDFGRPIGWALSVSAERQVPLDFEEIIFESTFFLQRSDAANSAPFDTSYISSCMADRYGDGRVKTRRRLVALLEAHEEDRRKAGSHLLPFHQESAEDEIDMCSPQSAGSQETDGSDGSVGRASDIAIDERGIDERGRESIFRLGYYPFSEYIVNSTRNTVHLEEQDRCILQQLIADQRDPEVDEIWSNAPGDTPAVDWVSRRLAHPPLNASVAGTFHSLSPLQSSDALEFRGKVKFCVCGYIADIDLLQMTRRKQTYGFVLAERET